MFRIRNNPSNPSARNNTINKKQISNKITNNATIKKSIIPKDIHPDHNRTNKQNDKPIKKESIKKLGPIQSRNKPHQTNIGNKKIAFRTHHIQNIHPVNKDNDKEHVKPVIVQDQENKINQKFIEGNTHKQDTAEEILKKQVEQQSIRKHQQFLEEQRQIEEEQEKRRLKELQERRRLQRQKQEKEEEEQRERIKKYRRQRQLKEQEEERERQKLQRQMMENIQRRREQRSIQKAKMQQNEQRRKRQRKQIEEKLNIDLSNGQHYDSAALLFANDQLAHFELNQTLVDLQINSLVSYVEKMPLGENVQPIINKAEELKRINESYMMVRDDPHNQRMAEGLNGYRIEIFNSVCERLRENGIQSMNVDGINLPGINITRGITKNKAKGLTQKVECEEGETCAICLSQFQNRQVGSKVKCGHVFHENCLQEWLQTTGNCPSCRFNLKK